MRYFWGFMAERYISKGSAVIKRLRTSDLKNYKYTTNIYELVPAGNKRTKIIWQKTIVKLVEQTKQIIVNQEGRKRHCSWIGHTHRKRSNRITRKSYTLTHRVQEKEEDLEVHRQEN